MLEISGVYKRILLGVAASVYLSLFLSSAVYADTKIIVMNGKNDACQVRETALKSAHLDAKHQANDECYELGDNWKYDQEVFSGFEQCNQCGSSGEYKCEVTQAKYMCRTRK